MLGLDKDACAINGGFIVVTQVGSQTFGIVVDGVFHTEEIVVKPMSSKLRHIALFSGNTNLGDGSVIMVIDPNGVAQAFGNTVASQLAAEESTDARQVTADEASTSLLVFRAGSTKPKAVPLSLITRRSTRRKSSSRMADIWCNTAVISCRSSG